MTNQDLIKWCDEQVKGGHELSINWEGGNDDGWVYMCIDGDRIENEYVDTLVDHMYNTLDYGSWAGDFSATGQAVYNPETKCFEGEDEYSQSESCTHGCDIDVRLPKKLWFDSLSLEVSGYDEIDADNTGFNIKNGFETEDHQKAIEKLKEFLIEEVNEEVEIFSKNNDYVRVDLSETIERSDFLEDDDELVYTVDHLHMMVNDGHVNAVHLELEELELNNTQNQ